MLSELEEALLALIGVRVRGWHSPTDLTPIIQVAAAAGYSAEDVQLAIDMLEKRGYLEVKINCLLFVTSNGYYAYADTNMPDFADLIQRVEREICAHNRTNNHDVALNLRTDQVAVDYIFSMMIQNGAIENSTRLSAPGPVWHILKLSPEFRFRCRDIQQS